VTYKNGLKTAFLYFKGLHKKPTPASPDLEEFPYII